MESFSIDQSFRQDSTNTLFSPQQLPGNLRSCCGKTIAFLRNHIRIVLGLSVFCLVILVSTVVLIGYIIENDFEKINFVYSQEIENFDLFIDEIDSRNEQSKSEGSTNLTQNIQNVITSTYGTRGGKKLVPYTEYSGLDYLIHPAKNCDSNEDSSESALSSITIMIIVKSAVNNYIQRETIRSTWAINDRVGLVKFKSNFMVAACDEKNPVPKALREQNGRAWTPADCQQAIEIEAQEHGDLIQSSAIDSFYNLTAKTVMILRWVSDFCPSDFLLILDDDCAFEVDNFIRYVENFALDSSLDDSHSSSTPVNTIDAVKRLAQEHFYVGYLRRNQAPFRYKTSKYCVSYDEYPFKRYPPFITGSQVLMSYKTVRQLYLASYFTRSIKLEDVYTGIMAHKLGIKPNHNEKFMCLAGEYLAAKQNNPSLTDCIAVHEIKLTDLATLQYHRPQL